MQTAGNNFVFARLHGYRTDQKFVAFAFGMRHDAGLAVQQLMADFVSGQADLFGVPGDTEGGEGAATRGRAHFGGDAGSLGDLIGDLGVPALPLFEIAGDVAAAAPDFDGAQHADDLLLAYLGAAAEGVMRGGVRPGGFDEV